MGVGVCVSVFFHGDFSREDDCTLRQISDKPPKPMRIYIVKENLIRLALSEIPQTDIHTQIIITLYSS